MLLVFGSFGARSNICFTLRRRRRYCKPPTQPPLSPSLAWPHAAPLPYTGYGALLRAPCTRRAAKLRPTASGLAAARDGLLYLTQNLDLYVLPYI